MANYTHSHTGCGSQAPLHNQQGQTQHQVRKTLQALELTSQTPNMSPLTIMRKLRTEGIGNHHGKLDVCSVVAIFGNLYMQEPPSQ
eukprot:1031950-Pelagomonas_calceolata.AAC.6